jgi:hypothetical protein
MKKTLPFEIIVESENRTESKTRDIDLLRLVVFDCIAECYAFIKFFYLFVNQGTNALEDISLKVFARNSLMIFKLLLNLQNETSKSVFIPSKCGSKNIFTKDLNQ